MPTYPVSRGVRSSQMTLSDIRDSAARTYRPRSSPSFLFRQQHLASMSLWRSTGASLVAASRRFRVRCLDWRINTIYDGLRRQRGAPCRSSGIILPRPPWPPPPSSACPRTPVGRSWSRCLASRAASACRQVPHCGRVQNQNQGHGPQR